MRWFVFGVGNTASSVHDRGALAVLRRRNEGREDPPGLGIYKGVFTPFPRPSYHISLSIPLTIPINSPIMSIKWDSFTNTVAGKQVDSENKHHGIDPTTGEELWPVPIASQKDVDAAVESATKAFETFRFVPIEKRKELLQKYCDVWTENAEQMINLLCKETGKPVSERCEGSGF
jgi:hypothetical protein